jgi:hypothetical protein
MSQITIEELKAFLQLEILKLQPTQNKLCFLIIRRIYHKMKIGVQFENINIDKELPINGHHRYICSLLLKKSINTNLWSSPSQIIVYKWSEIEIDTNDWESKELIDRHN